MSLKIRLASLLRAFLLSSGDSKKIPPYIGDVLVHHLSQHVDAILGNISEGKMAVFYLGVDAVAVGGDGVATSNGRGVFTGPLKTSTAQEKDMIVQALQSMPSRFRSRLDQAGIDVMVAAVINEVGGNSHSVILELSKADLAALRVEQSC